MPIALGHIISEESKALRVKFKTPFVVIVELPRDVIERFQEFPIHELQQAERLATDWMQQYDARSCTIFLVRKDGSLRFLKYLYHTTQTVWRNPL